MSTKTRNLGDVLQEFRQHRLLMQRELQKIIVGQDGVIEQIFAALQNVAPSQLADPKLFDFASLGSAGREAKNWLMAERD